MLLPDHKIAQLCVDYGQTPFEPLIEPYDPTQLQPASYDLRLERQFCFPGANNTPFAATRVTLGPGKMILGCTEERVRLPRNLAAEVQGRSGNARRGIQVESAGHVDPGYCGVITLELVNLGDMPVFLEKGMGIAKIVFHTLQSPCDTPYSGRHQFSHGPSTS